MIIRIRAYFAYLEIHVAITFVLYYLHELYNRFVYPFTIDLFKLKIKIRAYCLL